MGGNAFPDLHTPRMPAATYFTLKQRVQTLLAFHFKHVHTPIEACGKQDYGDLDFIVCEPFSTPEPPTDVKPSKKHTPIFKTDFVASMIGAAHSKRVGSWDSWNFAIAWPESDLLPGVETDQEPDAATDRPPRFVQVDIEVKSSLEDFKWMGWMHAHGDLNMVLTLMVRRKSLRISDNGLFMSIPRIEKISPKLAEVFVSKDPDQVMRFLGLDPARFYQPFLGWDDLMDFAASCRFHDPGFGRQSSEDSGTSTPVEGKENVKPTLNTDDNNTSLTTSALSTGPAPTASLEILSEVGCNVPAATNKVTVDLQLKTTDKKRRILRPMYRYWIDQYIPAHVDDPPRAAASHTKSETLAEAKDFFGEEFAERYEQQRIANTKRALEPKLWKDMRTFLNDEEADAGIATTAFKGWKRELTAEVEDMMEDLEAEGLVAARQAFIDMDYDKCLEWGKEHWKDSWQRQAKIDKEKSDANYRAKFEREAAKAKAEEEAAAVAAAAKVVIEN